MRPFVLHRMQVVRKEEKQNRLQSFIEKQLLNPSHHLSEYLNLTVLARACDSPVLRALAIEKEALQELGYKIRVVIVHYEPEASPEVKKFLSEASTKIGNDLRLLDAHEQLTIGKDSVWIGDCMRREPSKRDAYECYSDHCAETSSFARRSFEEIWNFACHAQPKNNTSFKYYKRHSIYEHLPHIGNLDEETVPLISTRH